MGTTGLPVGLHIQGRLKNKFYPDFIVKTKTGKYIVLEYKGEHLEGGEDAVYKEKIGKIKNFQSVTQNDFVVLEQAVLSKLFSDK